MQVVAHNRPVVNTAGENLAQLQNACLDPRLSILETFAEVFIQATQPRSTYAAVDAMKRSGLSWVNKLAAGLGHGRSLGVRTLLENQIGRNLGSDLSEGWVSALWGGGSKQLWSCKQRRASRAQSLFLKPPVLAQNRHRWSKMRRESRAHYPSGLLNVGAPLKVQPG